MTHDLADLEGGRSDLADDYAPVVLPSGIAYDFKVTGDCRESIWHHGSVNVWRGPSPAHPAPEAPVGQQGTSLVYPPLPCNPL